MSWQIRETVIWIGTARLQSLYSLLVEDTLSTVDAIHKNQTGVVAICLNVKTLRPASFSRGAEPLDDCGRTCRTSGGLISLPEARLGTT